MQRVFSDVIAPLSWLIGRWKSVYAHAIYPTMKRFEYRDEVQFENLSEPILNYTSRTWDLFDEKPVHLESGFLRINPGTNQVALIVSHGLGVNTIEEGTVDDKKVTLKSTEVSKMSFVRHPHVIKLDRVWRLNENGQLELTVFMETVKTPLTLHIQALYAKAVMQSDLIAPLLWLEGKWKSTNAVGSYPTIQPFTYCEELIFESIGQPMLNYTSRSWNPTLNKPMHLESGFLRIKPGTNQVAFMVAHNFGLTTLEEGIVTNKEMNCKSTQISRMSFAKEPAVLSVERCWKLTEGGNLEVTMSMETTKTPMTVHLKAVYVKV